MKPSGRCPLACGPKSIRCTTDASLSWPTEPHVYWVHVRCAPTTERSASTCGAAEGRAVAVAWRRRRGGGGGGAGGARLLVVEEIGADRQAGHAASVSGEAPVATRLRSRPAPLELGDRVAQQRRVRRVALLLHVAAGASDEVGGDALRARFAACPAGSAPLPPPLLAAAGDAGHRWRWASPSEGFLAIFAGTKERKGRSSAVDDRKLSPPSCATGGWPRAGAQALRRASAGTRGTRAAAGGRAGGGGGGGGDAAPAI